MVIGSIVQMDRKHVSLKKEKDEIDEEKKEKSLQFILVASSWMLVKFFFRLPNLYHTNSLSGVMKSTPDFSNQNFNILSV